MMNNNPEIRLNVIGNTDKNGSTNSNQNLSLKRSQEVINYLSENFGIEKNRFESNSNGEDNNLATEITSPEFPKIIHYQRSTEELILKLLINFIKQVPQYHPNTN